MSSQKLQNYFLLFLLGIVIVLIFFIFKPFIQMIVLAAVFAVIFQKTYQRILRNVGNLESLASLLTTLIIVALILTPISFLGMRIFQEARNVYISLVDGSSINIVSFLLNKVSGDLHRIFPSMGEFSIEVDQYLKQILGWLVDNMGAVFSNIAKLLINLLIFLVSFYYLLKDGGRLKNAIIKVSPLADANDELISSKLELAVNSVVKGNLTIALIQGVLTSFGFLIFGVPNAVLWGTVAAVAALIPTIGTAPVLLSAVLFLFFSGNIFAAIGLAIWGIVAVGLIDNFLAPKLIGKGMRLHPLFIFLSVLGGIVYFGPFGFLFGPLAVSLLFALLEIYSHLLKET